MKLLKCLLMVYVLLVLCQDLTAEDNQILSRVKRTHEQDLFDIKRKCEKSKNLKPVVIIPVNDTNTHKKVKDLTAEDNHILPCDKRTHEQDLLDVERRREKRKGLKPVIIIPVNDINTHKKVNVKVNKDYATISTKLPAKVQNENNTSHISPLLKAVNARKQLLNALKQNKNLPVKENEGKNTRDHIKEQKIDAEAKNITNIEENTENDEKNERVIKVEEKETESNEEKCISDKIKERERIRSFFKKGKKSEVVTPNHYDRMYSQSKRPYFFIEKERKKKIKTPKIESNDQSHKLKEEMIENKEEPLTSKVVNKKYVERLLKIEKTPSVAVLNKTDVESIEGKPETEIKDEVSKIENVVNIPITPATPPAEEPNIQFNIPIEIKPKTEPSKGDTRQSIEPSDSIYIQKQSLNELYEINDSPASYSGVTSGSPSNPEYTEICPDSNLYNQMNTYDCNIPYNNAPVCDDTSSYSVGPEYNYASACQNVPPGYENIQPNYHNQVTNQPYFYQQCRPANTGNSRRWRCWINTNLFYIRRPGYLPMPVQSNPYLSNIPNFNQLLVTPNCYNNQNEAYYYGQH